METSDEEKKKCQLLKIYLEVIKNLFKKDIDTNKKKEGDAENEV